MLKVLELFSGIGSQTQALKNIGIEHISTQCDVDKYAVNVYNQLHGETLNLGDISKLSSDDFSENQWDLITYFFPCTDISLAGHQKGFSKESGTRSSLLWECEKIFRKVKPKYLLMENVKNLVSKKFMPYFQEWLKVLENMGYKNYWQILNAKDFGVPQNRERVFCVSILGDHEPYEFPQPKQLNIRLKDVLEKQVDDKYYLSEKVQQRFKYNPKGQSIIGTTAPETRSIGQRDIVYNTENTMGALVATDYKQPKQIIEFVLTNGKMEEIKDKIIEPNDSYRFYKQAFETLEQNNCKDGDTIDAFNKKVNSSGICPTITTRPEGFKTAILNVVKNDEPKIINPLKGKTEYGWHFEQNVYDVNSVSRAIKAGEGSGNMLKVIDSSCNPFRIRKLTPKECWRLMGWKDEQIDKVKGISNSQLYKQAGNSIVVNVLEEIFRKLFFK